MLERIVPDPYYQQFEPVALSRPQQNETDSGIGDDDSVWWILFNNAVSEQEADRLVELGGHCGLRT
jgi:hypothetical protein